MGIMKVNINRVGGYLEVKMNCNLLNVLAKILNAGSAMIALCAALPLRGAIYGYVNGQKHRID